MVVLLLPVFPSPSVTLQVCIPASPVLSQLLLIVCEYELEAKQLLHVDVQW